eukprot:jgi/Botrbrau1/3769/Bobra.0183s0004.1
MVPCGHSPRLPHASRAAIAALLTTNYYLICLADQYGCPRIASIVDVGACALPYSAGNFQGYQKCDPSMLLHRPKDVHELLQVINGFNKVKGVGSGLSWNKEMFCAGRGPEATAIAMTEMANLKQIYTRPASTWDTASPTFPIKLNMDDMTVTVDAGVPVRSMLRYLSHTKNKQCPDGCFLEQVPQLIDQTVGGALSTGTHGSTSEKTTLSSQATGLTLAIANGTLIKLTEKEQPHLFHAAVVSVGRLGIIVDATFSIVPQPVLARSRQDVSPEEGLQRMQAIQDTYAAAKKTGDPSLIQKAMQQIGDVLFLWFQPEGVVAQIGVKKAAAPYGVLTNLTEVETETPYNLQRAIKTTWAPLQTKLAPKLVGAAQLPVTPLLPNLLLAQDSLAKIINTLFNAITYLGLGPAVGDAYDVQPTNKPQWLWLWVALHPSYEYEVCVPLEHAADAMRIVYELNDKVKGRLRTPTGFRVVAEEPAYLATSNGGARMCMEIDDFTSLSSGVFNMAVYDVVKAIMDKLPARLHWGKFGWPALEPCYDGSAKFGDSWCHFGCAVQELDPTGKFSSESNIWQFYAQHKDGRPAEFASCCSAAGFDTHRCSCAARPPCKEKPPSPESLLDPRPRLAIWLQWLGSFLPEALRAHPRAYLSRAMSIFRSKQSQAASYAEL